MYNANLEDEVKVHQLITQDAIDNLSKFKFATFKYEDTNKYFYEQSQKLLSFSMLKHKSKEYAKAFCLTQEGYPFASAYPGDAYHIDIEYLLDTLNLDDYYLIMHNHPSNNTFSKNDIYTFVNNDNVGILMVIGNKGSVYILEKTCILSKNQKETINNAIHNNKDLFNLLTVSGIIYSQFV